MNPAVERMRTEEEIGQNSELEKASGANEERLDWDKLTDLLERLQMDRMCWWQENVDQRYLK